MMTLYALVLVLFSLPASAWEPETYDTTVPVLPSYDYATDTSMDSDEHIATVTSPASNSITDAAVHAVDFFAGAETTADVMLPADKPLADVSIDPTFDFFADDFTAAVTSPTEKPITDAPIDSTVDWFADDEGWGFSQPVVIDPSIRASDWW